MRFALIHFRIGVFRFTLPVAADSASCEARRVVASRLLTWLDERDVHRRQQLLGVWSASAAGGGSLLRLDGGSRAHPIGDNL